VGYNPNYKWINPTYPIYNWGYIPLTKWDEPPSNIVFINARVSERWTYLQDVEDDQGSSHFGWDFAGLFPAESVGNEPGEQSHRIEEW